MDLTNVEMIVDLPPFEDFKNQLGEFFANQLTAQGYSFPPDEDPWFLAALFMAVKMRTISRRPRVVHWSDNLLSKSVILAPNVLLALQTIEAESIAGMDLNPRMSRKHKDVECHDNLFNEWGILHLHLGSQSRRPGELARGTSELLFVVVRRDAIYFLDQLNHGVFRYADSALLEIVHSNWPHLIAAARFDRGFVPPEDRFSPQSHAQLRNAGCNLPTVMSDGTVYMPPGGGMMMTAVKPGKRGKLNVYAVEWANDLFTKVARFHEWCMDNPSKLLAQIHRLARVAPTTLRGLRLCIDNRALFLMDDTTGAELRFDQRNNGPS